MTHPSRDIEHTLLRLLAARGGQASICPSEVARSIEVEEQAWRSLMPSVRNVAARLARDRVIAVTQHGTCVDINRVRGPIRLRRGAAYPAQD